MNWEEQTTATKSNTMSFPLIAKKYANSPRMIILNTEPILVTPVFCLNVPHQEAHLKH
jgi:hypothetical protein